jgi:hypothetical protein
MAMALLCGGFVGAFVSLDLAARFAYGPMLWPFGTLLGGLIAWIIVDFRDFMSGVRRSYYKVIDWKPNRAYWKAYFLVFGGLCVLYTNVVLVLGVIVVCTVPSDGVLFGLAFAGIGEAMIVLLSAFFALTFITRDSATSDAAYCNQLEQNNLFGWKLIVWTNPIGALHGAYLCCVWAAVRTPYATAVCVRITKAFIFEVFIHVHSERRMICFVDATLGAAAGYFLGSALVGAFVGVLLGIANYEIVSKRWLKIAPR